MLAQTYTHTAPNKAFSSVDEIVESLLEGPEKATHICAGSVDAIPGLRLSIKGLITILATNTVLAAFRTLLIKNDPISRAKTLTKIAAICAAVFGLWYYGAGFALVAVVVLYLWIFIVMAIDVYHWLRRLSSVPDVLVITEKRHMLITGIEFDRVERTFRYVQSTDIPQDKILKAPLRSRLFWGYAFAVDMPEGDSRHFELPGFAYKVPILSWLARSLNRWCFRFDQTALPTAKKYLPLPLISSTRYIRRCQKGKATDQTDKARLAGYPGMFSPRRIPRQAYFLVVLITAITLVATSAVESYQSYSPEEPVPTEAR